MNFFRKLIILVAVLAVAYIALFSVRIMKPGRAVMVEDMRSGTLVRVLTGKKYSFTYEGAMPWWFSLREIPLGREFSRVASIKIPSLSALDDRRYDIHIPIRVKYQADPEVSAAQDIIIKGDPGMDEEVFSRIQAVLKKELERYLDPLYRRDQLSYNRDTLESDMGNRIREQMKKSGLDVSAFSIDGGMYLPTMAEYNEALRHLDEMGRIKRKNDIETIILLKKLDFEKMANEEYYKKLNRISEIIKNNPEIIKYIYIDKLSDKLKVVSPVDSFDVLGDLSRKKNPVSPSKGDIDNLR